MSICCSLSEIRLFDTFKRLSVYLKEIIVLEMKNNLCVTELNCKTSAKNCAPSSPI